MYAIVCFKSYKCRVLLFVSELFGYDDGDRNYTLILQNSFDVHSFVIFCSFTSMFMRSLKSSLSVNCLSILVNGDIVK